MATDPYRRTARDEIDRLAKTLEHRHPFSPSSSEHIQSDASHHNSNLARNGPPSFSPTRRSPPRRLIDAAGHHEVADGSTGGGGSFDEFCRSVDHYLAEAVSVSAPSTSVAAADAKATDGEPTTTAGTSRRQRVSLSTALSNLARHVDNFFATSLLLRRAVNLDAWNVLPPSGRCIPARGTTDPVVGRGEARAAVPLLQSLVRDAEAEVFASATRGGPKARNLFLRHGYNDDEYAASARSATSARALSAFAFVATLAATAARVFSADPSFSSAPVGEALHAALLTLLGAVFPLRSPTALAAQLDELCAWTRSVSRMGLELHEERAPPREPGRTAAESVAQPCYTAMQNDPAVATAAHKAIAALLSSPTMPAAEMGAAHHLRSLQLALCGDEEPSKAMEDGVRSSSLLLSWRHHAEARIHSLALSHRTAQAHAQRLGVEVLHRTRDLREAQHLIKKMVFVAWRGVARSELEQNDVVVSMRRALNSAQQNAEDKSKIARQTQQRLAELQLEHDKERLEAAREREHEKQEVYQLRNKLLEKTRELEDLHSKHLDLEARRVFLESEAERREAKLRNFFHQTRKALSAEPPAVASSSSYSTTATTRRPSRSDKFHYCEPEPVQYDDDGGGDANADILAAGVSELLDELLEHIAPIPKQAFVFTLTTPLSSSGDRNEGNIASLSTSSRMNDSVGSSTTVPKSRDDSVVTVKLDGFEELILFLGRRQQERVEALGDIKTDLDVHRVLLQQHQQQEPSRSSSAAGKGALAPPPPASVTSPGRHHHHPHSTVAASSSQVQRQNSPSVTLAPTPLPPSTHPTAENTDNAPAAETAAELSLAADEPLAFPPKDNDNVVAFGGGGSSTPHSTLAAQQDPDVEVLPAGAATATTAAEATPKTPKPPAPRALHHEDFFSGGGGGDPQSSAVFHRKGSAASISSPTTAALRAVTKADTPHRLRMAPAVVGTSHSYHKGSAATTAAASATPHKHDHHQRRQGSSPPRTPQERPASHMSTRSQLFKTFDDDQHLLHALQEQQALQARLIHGAVSEAHTAAPKWLQLFCLMLQRDADVKDAVMASVALGIGAAADATMTADVAAATTSDEAPTTPVTHMKRRFSSILSAAGTGSPIASTVGGAAALHTAPGHTFGGGSSAFAAAANPFGDGGGGSLNDALLAYRLLRELRVFAPTEADNAASGRHHKKGGNEGATPAAGPAFLHPREEPRALAEMRRRAREAWARGTAMQQVQQFALQSVCRRMLERQTAAHSSAHPSVEDTTTVPTDDGDGKGSSLPFGERSGDAGGSSPSARVGRRTTAGTASNQKRRSSSALKRATPS